MTLFKVSLLWTKERGSTVSSHLPMNQNESKMKMYFLELTKKMTMSMNWSQVQYRIKESPLFLSRRRTKMMRRTIILSRTKKMTFNLKKSWKRKEIGQHKAQNLKNLCHLRRRAFSISFIWSKFLIKPWDLTSWDLMLLARQTLTLNWAH